MRVSVGQDGGALCDSQTKRQPLLRRLPAKDLGGFRQEAPQAVGDALQEEAAGFDCQNIQEVTNEVQQVGASRVRGAGALSFPLGSMGCEK